MDDYYRSQILTARQLCKAPTTYYIRFWRSKVDMVATWISFYFVLVVIVWLHFWWFLA